MIKIIALFATLLISNVYASNELPCTDIGENIINSEAGFTCHMPAVDENDQPLLENPRARGLTDRLNIDYLSPDGKSTRIRLHNKGAYIAWLNVEYFIINPSGTIWAYFAESHHIPASQTTYIDVPHNARDVKAKGKLNTGLIWNPVKTIFDVTLTKENVIWQTEDERRNIFQFDVWGTTLNPKWAQVQPANSIPLK